MKIGLSSRGTWSNFLEPTKGEKRLDPERETDQAKKAGSRDISRAKT